MRYVLAAGWFGLALAEGCAPSLRMVHEGNGYFENCYAADYNPKLQDMQREACWNAWLAHYTRHQPAHRIDYALRRVEALEAGEPPLGLPGLSSHWEQIASTSASGAELVTLQGPRAGAEAATQLDPSAEPSVAHGCTGMCNTYQSRCMASCAESLGPCANGCEHEKAICLGGCY